ncbi:hypothetical protein I350_05961 [Cryptococcus amylolentus CBS 6273]|uniref:Structure-specific endonuclease subunit SLX4 n=1 Tax=Cryptococcus amylolentus CBS 6273 TaxID=1296118 RepID=A0A1E3JR31_9TREE|nr:hypothetical protein I350_05961 [Cryptococcus amylolentus CBS 6273]
MIPRAYIVRSAPKLRPQRLSLSLSRLNWRYGHCRTMSTDHCDQVDDLIIDHLHPGQPQSTSTTSKSVTASSVKPAQVSTPDHHVPLPTIKDVPLPSTKDASLPATKDALLPTTKDIKPSDKPTSITPHGHEEMNRTRISRLGVATYGPLTNRSLDHASSSPNAKPIESTLQDVSPCVGPRRPASVHQRAHQKSLWRVALRCAWPVDQRQCDLFLADTYDTYDALVNMGFFDIRIVVEEVMGAQYCYIVYVRAMTHRFNHSNPPIIIAHAVQFLPDGGYERVGCFKPDDAKKGKSGPQAQGLRELCVTEHPARLSTNNLFHQAQQLICREALVKSISEVIPTCHSETGEFEQIKSKGWKHRDLKKQPDYTRDRKGRRLKGMIHNALSVRSAPNTLLELHAGSVAQAEGALAAQGSSNGLASVTSVKRSDLRGEAWDDEVIERIRSWIGHSSPPTLFDRATSAYNIDPPSPSNSHRRTSQSDADRVPYLATQPMGRSDLAQDYLKQKPSPPVTGSTSSEEGDSVPLSDDSEILVPASDSESEEELPLEVKKPFRSGGGLPAFAGLGKDVEQDVQPSPDVAIARLDVERKFRRILDSPIGGLHSNLSYLSITPGTHLWTEREVSPSSTLKCSRVSPVLERSTTPTAPYTRSFVDVDGWGAFAFEDEDPVAILSWEPKASEPDSASDRDILGYQAENSGTLENRVRGVMMPDSDGHLPQGDGGEDAELLASNSEVTSPISIDDHMPDYESWNVKELQARYGYRPVKDHTVLVSLAIECWKALAADPETPSNPPGPLLDSAKDSATWSVAVQFLPGGQVGDIAETSNPQAIEKGCQKVKKPGVEVDLEQVFYGVIKEDFDLYLRVLRYEPLSLDELISKCLRAGITKKGWKAHLKRYLDLQSITYFTEDPTKQRQRH